jgi:uncharacterized repeat protein (TIGR04076 family)
MCSVKLTILEARCRAGIHAEGQEFLVDGTCPPVCHELWQCIYPQVYALQNGGNLDSDESRGRWFSMACPDNGRVLVMGRTFDDN